MQLSNSRLPWIDYLRGCITLLVVAHHSSLAYTTFASFNKHAYILSTHPVVDSARSKALDIFEDFNDVFFMSLMFLISGIFVMRGIERKGRANFLRDRLQRLLLPFALGVTVLMLLAYYPAWLQTGRSGGTAAYIIDFFSVEAWPVGPPWFLWELALFNIVLVWVYPYVRDFLVWMGTCLAAVRTPLELLLLGHLVTWGLYMPSVICAGPDAWTGIGPFDFQVSRIVLYLGYFLLGAILGSPAPAGEEDKPRPLQQIFAPDGVFVRNWRVWMIVCLLVYALLKCSVTPLEWMVGRHWLNVNEAKWIYRSLWCLCCTSSCLAFLMLFAAKFGGGGAQGRVGGGSEVWSGGRIGIGVGNGSEFWSRKPDGNGNWSGAWTAGGRRWWESLSENAYGVYLVHYVFVTWCQYFLLPVQLPALVKFGITFVVAAAGSWALVAQLRRPAALIFQRRYRQSRL